jgi:hypothetical protein
MSDIISKSIFQISDIAELNSLTLFDYERSFNKYYNHINKSKSSLDIQKWFDHSNFNKTANLFIKDFEEYFLNFIFKSST